MPEADLGILRENLVEQLRQSAGPISGAIAEALRSVPRHMFVPEVAPEVAYRDEAIVTKRDADGQPISSSSQPAIMAMMLGQLDVSPGHRVLEIGAGTGYNAALISHLVGSGGEVVSIDIDADLVRTAQANLARAGYPRVTVVCADGAEGYPTRAPYDRMIATVGVSDLAPSWLDQLAPDGRIVVPLDLGGVQRSVAFDRADEHWVSRSVVPCGFMRLRGEMAGPERTYLLDRDSDLSIMVPDGAELDGPGLLAALSQPPARQPVSTVASPTQLVSDMGLWLAVNEPRWCIVSESDVTPSPRLPASPLRVSRLRITAGLQDRTGIAVLAGRPGHGVVQDIAALGYGPDGWRLATELAGHVQSWEAAGKPGNEGLRIDAYPRSTSDRVPGERATFDKRHTRLNLSWPSRPADGTSNLHGTDRSRHPSNRI